MDAVFFLNEEDRANFLTRLMQSLRCTYICLWWSYTQLPNPNNFLMSSGGIYREEHNQASSSSGSSIAQSLFDEYRQLPFFLENGRVPGIAFKNNIPYSELNQQNLQTMASSETQRRFYQEAQIKFAVFMGCRSGEIEIGFSNLPPANIEMEIKNFFPEDFAGQLSPAREFPQQPVDPNRPSSSSSSFRSQSLGSPDSSSLLAITSSSIPTTSHETLIQASSSILIPPITTIPSSQQEAIQALARIHGTQFPALASEEAAMTRAYLAVLTAPSSSQQTYQQDIVPVRRRGSAFRNYLSAVLSSPRRANLTRHSMFKRGITYYRRFNTARQGQMLQSRAPTGSQLQHMIAERKRREKINESFEALKALLPPETKKDKSSVLIRTREYLSSLKTQMAELSRRNQLLEAQLSASKKVTLQEAATKASTGASSTDERLDVRITHLPESTSQEERLVDLRVILRGEYPVEGVVFRLLEFLRQVRNVNAVFIEANTHPTETTSFNHVVLRLRIEEGTEWDESAFQEAVRRVVAELTR